MRLREITCPTWCSLLKVVGSVSIPFNAGRFTKPEVVESTQVIIPRGYLPMHDSHDTLRLRVPGDANHW